LAKTVLLAFVSILLVAAIIVSPDAAFQASLQGLTVWWNIVFPGLLPFLVLFELIAAFGLAHALAALAAPVTTKLFRLPGEAALTVILGWLGGYPAGAEAAASLRKRKLVTKQQGQRLLALSHMPNPLFMLVVIGAGFLHQPVAAILIAAAVWLSAIWLTLLSSWFSGRKNKTKSLQPSQQSASESDASMILSSAASPHSAEMRPIGLLASAAKAMSLGRDQDGRSFGKALGDAVTVSVQKLMVIGGFMIFAAVLAGLAAPVLAPLLARLELDFLLQALLEGHLGAYAAASWDGLGAGMLASSAAVAAALAWAGLGGIMQAGYFIAGTDLRLLPFVAARAIHALHAALFLLLLWKPATALLRRLLAQGAVPASASPDIWQPGSHANVPVLAADLPALWPYSIALCFVLAACIALSWLLLPGWRAKRTTN
jgi:sporulation integral membrane protein YlbJ